MRFAIHRKGIGLCAATAGLLLGGAAAARAQDGLEIDPAAAMEWLAGNGELAQQVLGGLSGELEQQILQSLRKELPGLLAAAESALTQASPEDMAELQPLLRQVAAHARDIPELAPYADWLAARLDYFDAARRVVTLVPSPRPTPKPPPAAPGTRPKPTPRPTPPADTSIARLRALIDAGAWKQRIEGRPPPARAAALVPRLQSAFRREGVPEALVWMAEVESSMNPAARSPVGAAGLFQLMPATARSVGLRTASPDERLDPDRSAGAAARYLRRLHGRFGSWPLALAAYNAGEARMAGLLKTRAAGARFEDVAGKLPAETQMYVPRVMETVRMRTGTDPARLPPPKRAE